MLAAYTYLGLGTMVIEDYQEPDVKLDLFGGSTGTYTGLDRFGRVVVQTWYDYGASTNVDQFTYGYDLAGNRLYRENTLTSGMDELYSYDAMNQLVNFQRGDLNVGKTALTGTIANEETFTLDATGNWSEYLQKTNGSTVLDQSRDHDEANQTGTITASTGTNWHDPTHDAAGNMTSIPKPSDPANGLTLTYDAWNRLVRVEDGEDVVAEYQYDGTGRRIVRAIDTASPGDPDGTLDLWEHFFYDGQQVLETRDGDDAEDAPESLDPHYQYVYSPRYIDAVIFRDENLDADNTCDDGRIYYLSDANFNVTTLIDETGTVLERYTYTPYGESRIYTPTWSSTRGTSLYGTRGTRTSIGRMVEGESSVTPGTAGDIRSAHSPRRTRRRAEGWRVARHGRADLSVAHSTGPIRPAEQYPKNLCALRVLCG